MSMPLWAPEEIVAATGARLSGDVKPATGASIDTRTLQPGDLFFAIAGEARDGHAFVRDALAKGAAAAVRLSSRPTCSTPCVALGSPRAAARTPGSSP